MPNPLYNDMMGAARPESNNNFAQMMQELNSFAQNLRGNPKQMVMQMLQSGQVSQAQYNQVAQAANQFIGMIQQANKR